MDIITRFINKVLKPDKSCATYSYEFDVTMTNSIITSYLAENIISKVSDKIAEDIYPEVKDKLMSHKGMEKIINETRLNLAKKFNS